MSVADRDLAIDHAAPLPTAWRGWGQLQAIADAMTPRDLDALSDHERACILIGLRELAGKLKQADRRAAGEEQP